MTDARIRPRFRARDEPRVRCFMPCYRCRRASRYLLKFSATKTSFILRAMLRGILVIAQVSRRAYQAAQRRRKQQARPRARFSPSCRPQFRPQEACFSRPQLACAFRRRRHGRRSLDWSRHRATVRLPSFRASSFTTDIAPGYTLLSQLFLARELKRRAGGGHLRHFSTPRRAFYFPPF